MPRFSLALALLAAAFFMSFSSARAQTPTSGCDPAPGTAPAIVCYGSTPCPAGYVDPVGRAFRNSNSFLFNKWLCQAAPPPESSSSAAASTVATATIPDISGSAVRVTTPVLAVISTTVGIDTKPGIGPYLTTPQHMSLYTSSNDSPGSSACAGSCAIIWLAFPPPASGILTLPDAATGSLAVIGRADGTQQVTYNDMPLYTYTGDFQPGDTNGQGLAGIYQLAAP
jgi:predicted lipoprotein with Yx(FWY)xxD motif